MTSRLHRTHLAAQRKRHHYRALGIAWRMAPLIWSMQAAGLSHRQIAEALNARGTPVPSQQSGRIGNTTLKPAPGPRKLWNKTQVQRLLKHLDDVSWRMRWWKRGLNKKLGDSKTTSSEFRVLMTLLGEDEGGETREEMWKYRLKAKITESRKRQEYREKVRKGTPPPAKS